MILDRKFQKFQIVDTAGKEIIPPDNYIFDYADSQEGIISFKSIYSFSKSVINSVTKEQYKVISPISYIVKRLKINIISLQ
jgi:hypothetical protein